MLSRVEKGGIYRYAFLFQYSWIKRHMKDDLYSISGIDFQPPLGLDFYALAPHLFRLGNLKGLC